LDDELAYFGLREIRDRIRRKEISAVALVEAQLSRIERLQPRVNAFITVSAEEARRQARAADAEAAAGRLRGPLHGVPLTLKDIVATRAVRTTSGSKILSATIPEADATVVERLRAAGAIFLGKTNLHEFAFGVSNLNPHFGPVRNPWDPERIPGGSSGGSGAALAAGLGYGSVGSDTGGSIRIPSALCGTVGLKPTYGRVSRHGVTPLAWSLDHIGPMARRVEDVALLYEILAGPDPRDPSTARKHAGSPSQRLGELPEGLRMGVARRYFFESCDAEVSAAVESALGDLQGLGLRPVEINIPEAEQQDAVRNVIAFAEAAAFHDRWIRERPQDYGPDVRESLRLGKQILATEYLAAQRARRTVLFAFRRVFESVDLLVSPAVPSPAPRMSEEKLSSGEPLRPGLLRLPSSFNTVGFPALVLPCGFTSAGLPIGLQLAAAPWREEVLLQVAHAYETIHAWWRRRPALLAAD
jgi:aspartyl-tRNA(Asn)/glutamyl-tRNA(Gln) amidotransferase subunit A